MLKVTRNNQAEESNIRTNMVAEHVGFKTNQQDRLRIAKARKDLFKYASDKKHKALLRQVPPPLLPFPPAAHPLQALPRPSLRAHDMKMSRCTSVVYQGGGKILKSSPDRTDTTKAFFFKKRGVSLPWGRFTVYLQPSPPDFLLRNGGAGRGAQNSFSGLFSLPPGSLPSLLHILADSEDQGRGGVAVPMLPPRCTEGSHDLQRALPTPEADTPLHAGAGECERHPAGTGV